MRKPEPIPQKTTCKCCGLLHPGEVCDCTGCENCERLDQRMRREKLESAIAWFSGGAKPSARRVSRGDLLAMLKELQERRLTDASTNHQ